MFRRQVAIRSKPCGPRSRGRLAAVGLVVRSVRARLGEAEEGVPGAHERSTCTPVYLAADRGQPYGRRNLKPAWWAPDGLAAIPTTALYPPQRAAPPAVPALHGSGSPAAIITTTPQKVVCGAALGLLGLPIRRCPLGAQRPLYRLLSVGAFPHGQGDRLSRRLVAQFLTGVDNSCRLQGSRCLSCLGLAPLSACNLFPSAWK
jgi:hypothetical protein